MIYPRAPDSDHANADRTTFLFKSRRWNHHTSHVIPNCATNAQVDQMKPFLNMGASTCGYVKSGNQALKA